MKLRFAFALSIAAPGLFGAMPANSTEPGEKTLPAIQPADKALADTVVRTAGVTQQLAQLAATTLIVAPSDESRAPPAQAAPSVPGAKPAESTAGAARSGRAASSSTTAAPARQLVHGRAMTAPGKHAAKDKPAMARDERVAEPSGGKAKGQRLAAAAAKPMLVRCVGRPETGSAAWYGGRYVGRRTSSGERLDTTHATAAHRTLPLNSLARVTNLRNGRSIIVRVTDRGPVSESLLIDMSPRAAEQLAMKDDGIVPVKVEQVVEVADAK
jgi:rare lipoprotein A